MPLPSSLQSALSSDGPMVRFDAYHLPFADIPLPNNFATVYDASSPTHRRVNASILGGTTSWEQSTRASLDSLSGERNTCCTAERAGPGVRRGPGGPPYGRR